MTLDDGRLKDAERLIRFAMVMTTCRGLDLGACTSFGRYLIAVTSVAESLPPRAPAEMKLG